MKDLVNEHHINRSWLSIGWLGVVAGLLILSFYAVIAGWALKYIFLLASGDLQSASGESASAVFSSLLSDPQGLIFWQTIFLFLCVVSSYHYILSSERSNQDGSHSGILQANKQIYIYICTHRHTRFFRVLYI